MRPNVNANLPKKKNQIKGIHVKSKGKVRERVNQRELRIKGKTSKKYFKQRFVCKNFELIKKTFKY